MRAKVLAIGLDGAPPKLIFKWAQMGLLPNLAGLMARGTYGFLKSTIPPMTCPAWTSSVTGVDIHKHGLYDFFLSADLARKRLVFADARKRRVKAVWSLLNDEGKKTVVINLPVTYPPEKVDGAMVSGMLTPSLRSRFTYPPNLKEELLDLGYMIDIGETLLEKVTLFKHDPKAYLQEVIKMVRKRVETALYLMREFEWDFFLVVFVALDRVNHLFWKHIDPKHLAHDQASAKVLMPWVVRCYKAVDEAVGMLVRRVNKKTNVIVYSDHGFRSLNYFVFFNNLLKREGLLATRSHGLSPLITQALLFKLIKRLPTMITLGFLPTSLRRTLGHAMRSSKEVLSFFDIDPRDTLAYQLGQFIHINKETIRSEEERAKLARRILSVLRKTYPITRVRAFTKEELFGRNAQVPDLVLLAEGTVSPRHLLTRRGELLCKYREEIDIPSLMWCGDHELYGILVMAGPSIKSVARLKEACIIDIAPTILKLMGLEIPVYMNGKPLL